MVSAFGVVQAASRDWLPVIVGSMPVVVLLVMNVSVAGAERFPAGDIAVLEIGTRSALGGDQLLGAYSRFGWRHPGPALFYWYSPFYRLSGNQLGGLVVAATTVSLLSIGLIVRTTQRLAGRTSAWAVAIAVLAACSVVGIDHFQSPWNSDVLILPIAALAVVGAASVVGRRWALPVAAVLASWVAQAHLGAAPLALAFGMGILLLTAWRQRRSLGAWLLPAAAAVMATALMWSPVVWEEVNRSPGNLTEIRQYYANEQHQPHGWTDSIGAVATAATGGQDDFSDGRPLPALRLLGASLLLAVVTAGAIVGWARRRRGVAHSFQGALCTLGLGGVVIAVISVRSVDGPILRHLLSFVTGLGLVLWVAAALTMVSALPSLPDRRWLRRLALGSAVVVTGALVLEALSIGPWNRNPDYPSTAKEVQHRLLVDNEQAATTADVALRSPLVRPGSRVEVAWPAGWEIGAGVVNALQRQGVQATVPAENAFIFGDVLAADGTESARVVVVPERREYPSDWPPPPQERFHSGKGVGFDVYVVPLTR